MQVKFTKYTVLRGISNKRKDRLLDRLLFGKLGYFEVEREHARAGYTSFKNREKRVTDNAKLRGFALAAEPGAVAEFGLVAGKRVFSVKSSIDGMRYKVVLDEVRIPSRAQPSTTRQNRKDERIS